MPLELTEADEFTEPVTVPEAGDDRTAASIVSAFQALTNRSRHVMNKVSGLFAQDNVWTGNQTFAGGHVGVEGEVLYTDATGAAVPKQVTIPLPATGFRQGDDDPPGANKWVMGYGKGDAFNHMAYIPYWTTTDNRQTLLGEFRLPDGAVLVSLRFRVKAWNGASGYVGVMQRNIESQLTFGDNNQSQAADIVADESGTTKTVTLALTDFANLPMVGSKHLLFVYAGLVAAGAGSIELSNFALTYLDPGPRNY